MEKSQAKSSSTPVQRKPRFFCLYFFAILRAQFKLIISRSSRIVMLVLLLFPVRNIHTKSQLDIAEWEISSCMTDHWTLCNSALVPNALPCSSIVNQGTWQLSYRAEPGKHSSLRSQRCKKVQIAGMDESRSGHGTYPPGSLLGTKWDWHYVCPGGFFSLLRCQLLLITVHINHATTPHQ